MALMRWIKWTAAVLVSVALAALLLAPARESEAVPEGRVVIRYWEKWTGREGEQMRQIVDWFNRTVGAEKGIYVRYISMSQVDQKTLVSTAAGDPPEVAGLWDNQVAQFAAMDALEPLGERARKRGLTRDYYKPVYYDACSYEGELYAFPSTPAAVAMHYNKAIIAERATELRAAGFDPEKLPTTIDELDRFAAVLDKRDANGRLVRAGHLPQEPGWWLTNMVVWFGGKLYDPATRRVNYDGPEMVSMFEWIARNTDRVGLDEMRRFRAGFPKGFDSPQTPFFAGTVAIVQQGPWMANYIDTHNPKMANLRGLPPEQLRSLTREQRRANAGWGAAAFPSAVPGMKNVTMAVMDTLVIPRTAKHKDEAFEFVAFVQRQDVMEKLVSLHCKNSPLAKMSPEYLANHPNPYIEVFDELAASPNAVGIPPLPVWPEVSAEIGVMCEQVYLQKLTPAEAAKQLQARCQEIVDRFFERQAIRKRSAVAEGSR